jgi:CubicO group peptidase (beta-lactamase class C family)
VTDAGKLDASGGSAGTAGSAGVGGSSGSGGFGASAGSSGAAGAAGSTLLDLESIVEPIASVRVDATGTDTSKSVAMVVAVVAGDQHAVFGYGAKHLGGPPPDGDTFFGLASVSKIFTGLAMAELVRRGDVDPQVPAQTYLAQDLTLPQAGGVAITLEHLVSHRAGFPKFPKYMADRNHDGVMDLLDGDPSNDFPPCCPAWDYSRDDLRLELETYDTGGEQLLDTPGNSSFYSNHGLGLVSIALADHLGLPDTDTLLRDLVLTPLEMNDSGTRVEPFLTEADAGKAQGYYDYDGVGVLEEAPFSDMGVLAGSGEVISTGNDMLRMLQAWTGNEPKGLSDAIDLATTPIAIAQPGMEIAYALEVGQEGSVTVFNKGGTSNGYLSYIRFSREPAAGVVVLTSNGTGGGVNSQGVALAIHQAIVDQMLP